MFRRRRKRSFRKGKRKRYMSGGGRRFGKGRSVNKYNTGRGGICL